jgi:hypothetical protein
MAPWWNSADAVDLKSATLVVSRFESGRGYQVKLNGRYISG